mmetsp:Transcript_33942/g.104199  ORF Transcript_33942/g.104199 Transcript_33942/m.104199 type:complete len:313 (+) Transcript_33942:1600-2538(+)
MGIKDWFGGDARWRDANDVVKHVDGARLAAEDASLVDVAVKGGRMRVFLPRTYPQDRPVLQLLQPTEHALVDKYNQVRHPKLENWRPHKSRLVDVVRNVKEALDDDDSPPRDADTPPPPPPPPVERGRSTSETHIPLPAIPAAFPEQLDSLSEDELAALLEGCSADGCSAEIADLVEELPQLVGMKEVLADLRKTNLALVEATRAAVDAREREADNAAATRNALADSLDAYDAALNDAGRLAPADPAADASRRHAAKAADADAASMALADAWHDKGCKAVDAFLEAFLETRAAFHEQTALAGLAERRASDLP